MNLTRTFIALLGFVFVLNAPVNGQKPYTLDKSTTTLIDNALMECFYDYKVKAHPSRDSVDKTVTITFNTLLQANATVSKFWDWHSFMSDSVLFTAEDPTLYDVKVQTHKVHGSLVRYIYIPVIFKNYPKEKLTVIDDIAPDMYLYEQPKTGLTWSLKEDTMTVCGYLCNKAVASYGGREWSVWYAPDIAISDGPWKLYGLPGLILKAIDATGEHAFEAVNIRNAVRPIYLINDTYRLKIGKEKFLKQKQVFEKDWMGNLKLNPTLVDWTFYESAVYVMTDNKGFRTSILRDVVFSPIELK